MNSNIVKALIIAVDVIIVCLLIALGRRNYLLSAQLASTDAQQMTEAREGYLTSDVSSLEGVSLKGATVINAVKKYKDEVTVRVITESGQREYNEDTPFLNVVAAGDVGVDGNISTTGETIIDPDGIFYCTHETNLNDVVTCIVFTQKGVSVMGTGEDYWTAANIRQKLVQILNGFSGVDSSSTTSTLLSTVESELSYADKAQLAQAVGGSAKQKYGKLVDAADTEISDLTTQVEGLKNQVGSMYTCEERFQYDNSDGDLGNTTIFPNCPVMAYVQDTTTKCSYYYYLSAGNGGYWVSNDDPEFNGATFDKLAFVPTTDGSGYYLYDNLGTVKYTVFYKPESGGN